MSRIIDTIPLAEWQGHFAHSLLNELSPTLAQSFQVPLNSRSHQLPEKSRQLPKENHQPPEESDKPSEQDARLDHNKQQRFTIYQNNVFYSLTTALGDLYPVVKQLVGDDFFTGTASYYLRQEPPKQAAMVHFGQSFPEFLKHFEHTSNMPYLVSVATLELARHRAYHAEDKHALSIDEFATLLPEQLAQATLTPHPSLQLINAEYAMFTIWQMHQASHAVEKSTEKSTREDSKGDAKENTDKSTGESDKESTKKNININEPEYVLIVRPEYEVVIFSIDRHTYRFVESLIMGSSIATAISVVSADKQGNQGEDHFDPSHAINFLIQQQLFTAIH